MLVIFLHILNVAIFFSYISPEFNIAQCIVNDNPKWTKTFFLLYVYQTACGSPIEKCILHRLLKVKHLITEFINFLCNGKISF